MSEELENSEEGKEMNLKRSETRSRKGNIKITKGEVRE